MGSEGPQQKPPSEETGGRCTVMSAGAAQGSLGHLPAGDGENPQLSNRGLENL